MISKLSPVVKRNILRIIPFGVMWLVFSIVYTLLERGILGRLTIYPATGNPYSFTRNIFITPVSALVTGLLIGGLEILYFGRLFAKKSLGKKIILKSTIYLAIIVVFVAILSFIANAVELHESVFAKKVWMNVWAFCTDFAFLSIIIYIATIIIVSQFYTEVSDHIGQGVLYNFFAGKYHNPAEEERIYMFLDMKSSTTIAESLGHTRYFDMLKSYYADISMPVIQHEGEIYQYVGDEMVVSWKLQKGLQNNNCIGCFFAMKAALEAQREKYQAAFGLLPEFKAGLHYGKVTTGEIGIIKKEIIFTGDTLNTTARIQSLCNHYKVDLLISGDLIKRLDLPSSSQVLPLGEQALRGRDEKVELFTILNFEF